MELKEELYNKILNICSEADDLVDDSKYEGAIDMYLTALDLVPLPKEDWEISTWIYTALGDTYYFKRDFVASKNYLFNAINCPNGINNPFIMLRLGESLFEQGELDIAKEYLLRAYMLEGYHVFCDEEEKYFNLIKDEI